jgi:hypothetical protein
VYDRLNKFITGSMSEEGFLPSVVRNTMLVNSVGVIEVRIIQCVGHATRGWIEIAVGKCQRKREPQFIKT